MLTHKLETLDASLRDAKADRKEGERERRTSEAVEKMKRQFPGEHQCAVPCRRGDCIGRVKCGVA